MPRRASGAFSSTSVGNDGFSSARFTDSDPDTGRTRLSAVVVWKGAPGNLWKGPAFPWLTKWFWVRLPTSPTLQRLFKGWFLVRYVWPSILWSMRPRLRSRHVRDLRAGWTTSVGEGKNKIEFNRTTHEVRIRGRVFRPKDDRTFVLLVEDAPDSPGRIRVTELAVTTTPGDPADAWNRALNAHPVYAEFVRRA